MTQTNRLPLLAIIVLLAVANSSAQAPTGTPPFGSFGGGPDVINLANLNSHIVAPVLHKAGRAGFNFTYDLSYDSSVWFPVGSSGSQSWQPVINFGWRGQTEVATGYMSHSRSTYTCQIWIEGTIPPRYTTGHDYTTSDYVYHDSFGISHSFPDVSTDIGPCGSGGGGTETFLAADGSGYTISTDGSTIFQMFSRSGALINPPVSATSGSANGMDRNGNKISVDTSGHFTDTLGTTALTVAGGAPNPLTFTYTPPSGGSATVSMSYVSYTVQTNFGCSGIGEYGPTSNSLVDRITLADNSFYQFTYEPTYNVSGAVTGRLASVKLPTGGTISYQYNIGGTGLNGIACADGSASVLTRATPDGTWTYARSGSSPAWTTTVTDPQGNQTVINFQGIYETQRQVYQGAVAPANLLRTWTTCYNGNTLNCPSTAVALPITRRTVTDQYGSSGPMCQHIYKYTSFGMLTEQDDYDYGSPGPGPLLKKTLITFANLGNNLNASVQIVTVQDGSGTTKFHQDVTYDESAKENTPCITGAPQHDDTGHGCSFTGRGNPTSVTTWADISAGVASAVTSTMTYDSLGNLRTATDPLSHATTLGYTDAWSTTTCTPPSGTNAYVTSVSNALSEVTSAKHDPCTGMLASVTDPNNQTTSFSYDSSWRPSQTNFPDGGQTSWSYNTTSLPASVTGTTKMNATQNIVGTTVFDGLGRDKQDQLNSDPLGVTYADTTYDSVGRVASVSNPHRASAMPTDGITSYQYDALSRATKAIPPDGSSSANNVSTVYSNNCATTTDQAGKVRKACYDPLGRMTQVFEPDATGALNYETDYQYDALNNLLCVHQRGTDTTADKSCTDATVPASWRPRTFAYDALSRLTSATNPESGTVTYAYGANGNLITKTAPAPNQTGAATVITTYTYDALNRVTQKSYSDTTTPTAYFMFDTPSQWGLSISNVVGRLSEAWNYAGPGGSMVASVFSYDSVGRVMLNNQCDPSDCPSGGAGVNYTYDLASDMTSYTTGVGATFTQAFDTASRATQLTSNEVDAQHPATLATVDSSLGYLPAGAIRKLTLGNGLTETAAYNNRVQPCRMNVNSSGSYLTNCGDAVPSGNVLDLTYGFNSGTANNGNVASIAATGNQSFSRTYTYDSLNRLATMNQSSGSATSCSSTYGLSWTYDIWGNRTDQTVTGGTCNASHVSVNAKNQLVDPVNNIYHYDAAGNLTSDGSHSYTYDAENRLIQVDGTPGTCSTATACYVYDALGRRVEKITPSRTNNYIYDLAGNVVTEWCLVPGFTGWCTSYMYLNGQLVAQYSSGTTYFVHKDHLGSTRLVSNLNQSIADNLDYLPYGEQTAGDTVTTHKFTGDERDSETSLDHTWFRQYSPLLGRWITPDPFAGYIDNPESLNRYSYVLNSSTNLVDPLGLDPGQDDTLLPKCPPGVGGPDGGGNQPMTMHLCDDGHGHTYWVGDYDGEKWCPEGGGPCEYWNARTNTWEFQPPPTDIVSELWDYFEHVPLAASIYIPIPYTVGTVSVMIPLAHIPSSHTNCVGLGLAATTPTGKFVAGGPLLLGNLNNAKSILSGWGYNFGAQATPFIGVQAVANSSGALGGPTLATGTGLSAGYGYSTCR